MCLASFLKEGVSQFYLTAGHLHLPRHSWQLQATLSIETGTTVEVLLGFEHLHGAHTGSYLSETVIEILRGHGIADRVLSVTTDNATDNNTMIATQYSHWF